MSTGAGACRAAFFGLGVLSDSEKEKEGEDDEVGRGGHMEEGRGAAVFHDPGENRDGEGQLELAWRVLVAVPPVKVLEILV